MVKLRLTILALGILFLAFYVLNIFLPVNEGYNFFTEYAANLINKKHRLPAIRNALSSETFFVVEAIVYTTLALILVLLASCLYFIKPIYSVTSVAKNRLAKSYVLLIKSIKETDRVAKIIFGFTLIYIIVQSVWYMHELPFIHDEAYTISNFIIPGPVAAITFYPYPNNHIFFSLVSYPFSLLPLKPEIAFRLPSLLAALFTCFILFRLLLKFLPARVAALGVVVFVCILPVMVYSIFARGYSLVYLFSCLSIYALIRIIEENSRYHRILLIVFSVLGLYTLPSYIYPMAAIFAVYLAYGIVSKNMAIVRNALMAGIWSGLFSVLLYSPVIITSGGWGNFLKILYQGYEETVSIFQLGSFLKYVYALQFFDEKWLASLFLLFTISISSLALRRFRKRNISSTDKILFWVCLLGLLIPAISFMVQRKFAASRTHSYVALFFTGLVFISLKHCITEKWKASAFVSITLFMISMNVVFAHKSGLLKGEIYFSETGDLFAEKMLNGPTAPDSCYTFDLGYLAHIQLKYALNKRQLTVYQNSQGSPSTTTFNYGSNYGWLITSSENDFEINYDSLNIFYESVVVRKNATLWKRKE